MPIINAKCLAALLVSFIFLFLHHGAIASQRKIVLAADYWCPYNCIPDSKNPGYLVELAKKAFEIYDIEVEYRLMPWSIALEDAKKGKIDGIIGLDLEGHDLLLPTKPQAYSVLSSFTTSDTHWVYDGIESLKGKKITAVLDYNLGGLLKYISDSYSVDQKLLVLETGDNAIEKSIDNLISKKAEIYIEDEMVMKDYLFKNIKFSKSLKNAGKINSTPFPIYIGFSRNITRSTEFIKMLEDGIESLDASGDLEELKQKYTISY